MTKEKMWRFVSNLNATDDGLNDAGIETFSAESVKSMVREVIQNAIDQKIPDSKIPVTVEFDDFTIQKSQFPNGDQFEEILNKCIASNTNDTIVVEFFKQAKDLMNKPINVMRISDFNTTGLVGAETGEKGTPWHGLIKAKGSSNKNITSGGSFGIGKSAPFACSNLRTVLYSSKVDDIVSYIGVSRLTSFEDEGRTTIGTGFYSEDDNLRAIKEKFGLNEFSRNENGTDIYIMGFDDEGSLKDTIKEASLLNFFVSIWKGLLIIKYKELVINKDNLGQYIASLDDKDYLDLKKYYRLLVANPSEDDTEIKKIVLNNDEYGKEFGIRSGECTLLLMRDEDLNRRILMTRQPGMSLFKQSNINGNISFTGILLIEGDTMNELFKTMEMPAHDAWEPKRCKVNKQKYVKAYEGLRKYLRDKVIECFGQTEDEIIPAYGMEEFFSDIESSEGEVKTSVLEGKVKTEIKRNKSKKQNKNRIVAKDGIDFGNPDEPKPHPKNLESNNNESSKSGQRKQEKEPKFKYIDLKKRLLCKNEKNGEYILKFTVPKKKKQIKLEFIGVAEQGNYPLNLRTVDIKGSGIVLNEIKGNLILVNNIPSKCDLSIDFSINFDRKCMMEVNYYEA